MNEFCMSAGGLWIPAWCRGHCGNFFLRKFMSWHEKWWGQTGMSLISFTAIFSIGQTIIPCTCTQG